jgi:hypothetical protein
VNLPLARSFGPARYRVLDFEVSGCAQSLQRELEAASAYALLEALAPLEKAYCECEAVLLYWTGPYVRSQDGAPLEANPLEDVLHELTTRRVVTSAQGALARRPLGARELRVAMRRAREFALEAYPNWRWPPRVVGALTLAHLLGALLRRCAAIRRMDDDDPATATYRKLIEIRSAWMPG